VVIAPIRSAVQRPAPNLLLFTPASRWPCFETSLDASANPSAIVALIMCGRITATFEFSDIRVRWNLDRDLPKCTPRYNVAPETSPNIPVIVRQRGGNECRLMHWGLIPHWATDPSIGNRMINARAETLTELPSFKPLVDRRRCIIPADGFYEWRKEGKRKVPMWVHLKNRKPFGLAGLWDV
jgi:putative SOS response-associated peptidase YedK